MPIEVEGTPVWHETITVPSGDDQATPETIADPITLVFDNVKYLGSLNKFVAVATFFDDAVTYETIKAAVNGSDWTAVWTSPALDFDFKEGDLVRVRSELSCFPDEVSGFVEARHVIRPDDPIPMHPRRRIISAGSILPSGVSFTSVTIIDGLIETPSIILEARNQLDAGTFHIAGPAVHHIELIRGGISEIET